jgi:hypothetical protein
VAWFYEIRDTNNSVLKREHGFADQDAAKIAARANARKMKTSPESGRPKVGTVLAGQNTEKPTR